LSAPTRRTSDPSTTLRVTRDSGESAKTCVATTAPRQCKPITANSRAKFRSQKDRSERGDSANALAQEALESIRSWAASSSSRI
jgi:hypothetical protein